MGKIGKVLAGRQERERGKEWKRRETTSIQETMIPKYNKRAGRRKFPSNFFLSWCIIWRNQQPIAKYTKESSGRIYCKEKDFLSYIPAYK